METGYIFEMEEDSFGDVLDMVFKGEVAVENDSEVADGRGQSGIVNGEGDVVIVFGEGFGTDDDHFRFITVQFEEVVLHPGSYFSETDGES